MRLIAKIVPFAIVLAAIVALPATAADPPPVPVVSAPVKQGDVPIVLNGLGTVQALNTAVIRSQVTGLLQSVDFVEGQQVRRGDLLAQVDPRPAEAHLAETQARRRLGTTGSGCQITGASLSVEPRVS
jgi:multidrug efflux system membrane fusion protein